MTTVPGSFSSLLTALSCAPRAKVRQGAPGCAARVCALCALTLTLACETPSATIALGSEAAAASTADVDELLARIEALEQTQADQAARLEQAEAALNECLSVAENAQANATAAQERSAELRDELDEGQLWPRLERLEEDMGTLWAAVGALYD